MTLSIRNDEVERLARELASQRGVSVTEAIRQSLESALGRNETIARRTPEQENLFQKLMEITERSSRLPVISDASEDEILGYDEYGVPELPR